MKKQLLSLFLAFTAYSSIQATPFYALQGYFNNQREALIRHARAAHRTANEVINQEHREDLLVASIIGLGTTIPGAVITELLIRLINPQHLAGKPFLMLLRDKGYLGLSASIVFLFFLITKQDRYHLNHNALANLDPEITNGI